VVRGMDLMITIRGEGMNLMITIRGEGMNLITVRGEGYEFDDNNTW
jgi:hypothetical protein